MRDKHYKLKGFRLSDETIKKLESIKKEKNISYNLLFVEIIKLYDKSINNK